MKTKILTAISILIVIASISGCASPKAVPEAPQLQASSDAQELQEATENPQAAVSTAGTVSEEPTEKEIMVSATESVPELPSEPAPTQPAKEISRPSETVKPTEPEPTTPPQPTETPSPTKPAQTRPAPTEPTPTEPVATEPEPTAPQQPTESAPTEPAGCQHDWICVRHEEEGHWIAGIVCDCGWTVYGDPNELISLWNAHSASFLPEESLFEHGGCGCVDEWIVDVPAWEEWYCSLCGEPKT